MSCGRKSNSSIDASSFDADEAADLDDQSEHQASDFDDDMAEAFAALDGNDTQDAESASDDEAALDDDDFSDEAMDLDAIEASDSSESDADLDEELEDVDLDAFDDEAFDVHRRPRRRRTSGVRVFQVMRKQAFDWTFLAASTTAEVVLQRALRVPPGYYFWLGLRIHNRTIGTGDFSVSVFQTLPSLQDPAEFSSGTASMVLSVDSGDTPPALKVARVAGLGPVLKITLAVKQGSVGPFQLYAELSAVLLARPA